MLDRAKKRILAAVLTQALLLTQTALYARAETDGPEGNPSDGGGYASSIINPDEQESGEAPPTTLGYSAIAAFDPLDADVAEQKVPAGTALADLNLPDTLAATVEYGNGNRTGAKVPVARWHAELDDDPLEMGMYIFIPELAVGYTPKDGVALPEITVRAVMGVAPSSGVVVGNTLTVHLSGKPLEEEVTELVLPAAVQRLKITGRLTQADLNYIWNWTGDYVTGSGTTELTGLTRLDLGGAALPGAEVPDYQFCGHSTLNQIVLPVSLRSIGDYAFAGTGLTELDLKEYPSLAGIGAGAFREVDNLKIVLPAQVTLLKTDTFTDCADLELCLLYNGVVSCEAGALTNAQGFVEVYHGQLTAYNSSSEWYGVNTGTYYCTMMIFGVVTYLGGEGQGEYTELPIPYNENYLIKSADETGISRTGYVSTQWNTQADGSGTSYNPGDQVQSPFNMTLYAMWVPDNNVPKVTLTLYDDGLGTTPVMLPSGSDYTLGDTAHYSIPDPPSQRFQHWNTAQDGSGQVYYPGQVITMDGNRALYGQWTTATETLTVTYDSNNGTGGITVSESYTAPHTVEDAPSASTSRAGYVLTSWNTNPTAPAESFYRGIRCWYTMMSPSTPNGRPKAAIPWSTGMRGDSSWPPPPAWATATAMPSWTATSWRT